MRLRNCKSRIRRLKSLLAGGIQRAGTLLLAGGIQRAGTLAAKLVGPALMFDSRELDLYGLTVMNAVS